MPRTSFPNVSRMTLAIISNERIQPMGERLYTVSELADDLDITPRTLRFYEDKGLIVPQRAGQNRVYTHKERARMILILRGKRLGFSLREIKEWLDLYDADHDHLAQTRLLAKRLDERMAKLEQQRHDIEATLNDLRQIRSQADTYLARASRAAEEPAGV